MPLIPMNPHALGAGSRDGSLLDGAFGPKKTAAAQAPASLTAEEILATLTPKQASAMGIVDGRLNRIAGNVYECPATRDFWAVRAGKLVRLTGKDSAVVDDGENLPALDTSDPEEGMSAILADLETEF